jgi:hypothetical protein
MDESVKIDKIAWNDTMIQPFVHEDMARRAWGYDKFMRDFDPTQTGGFATSTFENKKVGYK